MNKHIKRWSENATKAFSGKTIKRIGYTNDAENESMDWHSHAPVIEFTDGTWFLIMQDDEGNGPGAIATSDSLITTIPVIRQTNTQGETA